ncbi:transcriptional regulator, TetR family [Chitinophaga ginsengisegetis]|uniref:Transcriptional regulator, TetR family n=1 Tax=Chitinophaga ginsengisegetis TaxID=393003 RepID=A0A1T5NDH0_9BACT|nr:TetR/AcrR family transcriptional regulator [Chitinophaga ginsengisegetis]MDR6570531.1 AcrR family transcriptional regulator [Chitinophaga ginsengisegetis]MDR6650265.1 AcrR family transcriptional regulator [Chitinophaga ginsengisegetis]MDR6656616.1 AcrR family transcriptional regulator [Chitinophaga ginsengisegetis]SKC98525.1 transcriptional regulator, TetR family [Chitinophaga ginsengisegetis]
MRYRDENKIQAIRECAIEMVAKDGLENFGINRLAKAAGVSPATIYIYYKDKEDLLTSISIEEGIKMTQATLKDFDPKMSFKEGLWVQWKNRAAFALDNHLSANFFEQLRNSTYKDKMMETITHEFRRAMGDYVHNAVTRGEIDEMPLEVYWSVAFAPLYSLIKFHNEGQSLGGRKFKFSEKIMKETFDCVVKGLMK